MINGLPQFRLTVASANMVCGRAREARSHRSVVCQDDGVRAVELAVAMHNLSESAEGEPNRADEVSPDIHSLRVKLTDG